jgi:hypothetical protein
VNDLIPELVFNSIRHGKAHSITVTLEVADSRVLSLSVVDDGTADITPARHGLGSALLDEASMTWSRARLGDCTATTCLLPFASPRASLLTPLRLEHPQQGRTGVQQPLAD